MKKYRRLVLIFALAAVAFAVFYRPPSDAKKLRKAVNRPEQTSRAVTSPVNVVSPPQGAPKFGSYWSEAVEFQEAPALGDIKDQLTAAEWEALANSREDKEKNEVNTRRVKPDQDPLITGPFVDQA